jgi:DNA recombination protein RmuC
MPEILQILIELVILFGLAAVLFLLLGKKGGQGRDSERLITLTEKMAALAEQNRDLKRTLDQKLSESHRVSQDQFVRTAGFMNDINKQTQEAMTSVHRQSQRVIAEVTERLTKLDETNKQVVNFSSQLQNLQDILKNPKQRGVLGEYFLEETLKNVLPPNSYQMQYAFKNNEIVDAVVFVKEKIIPIDSKFSLENYERILNATDKEEREKLEKLFRQDLKIRIDETSKYVRPAENTMDFAFMFIPSEAIYYDLLINKVGAVKVNTRDLIEYAFKDRRVIIVSPTSFLAYLQTVLQGLRALQIEESAKAIKQNVEKLGKHLLSYEDFMKKLGVSMGTTVNHYNNAYKELAKIDKDVVKIVGKEAEVDAMLIDKPKLEL